jgi:penicillin-binding protein 2
LVEVERVSKVNLIPDAIKRWYYKKDSARLAKIAIEEAAAKAETNEENNKPITEATLENNSTPIGDKNTEPKIKTKPSLLLNEDKKKRRANAKP